MRVQATNYPSGRNTDEIRISDQVVLVFHRDRRNRGVTDPIDKKDRPDVDVWLQGHKKKAEDRGYPTPYFSIPDEAADLGGNPSVQLSVAQLLEGYRNLTDHEQTVIRTSIGVDTGNLREVAVQLRDDLARERGVASALRVENSEKQAELDAAFSELDAVKTAASELDQVRSELAIAQQEASELRERIATLVKGQEESADAYPVEQAREILEKRKATKPESIRKILEQEGLPIPDDDQLAKIQAV